MAAVLCCGLVFASLWVREKEEVPEVTKVVSVIKMDHDFAVPTLILADGKPLLWIAKWYGTPIKEKISGSDLFPLLCDMAANKFKGLQVVGTYSPPFGFEKSQDEMDKIKSMIKEAAPHILIVGLGCPKQEKFMYHHCKELGVPITLGLGASFDFEAGNIKRAPRWMSNHGLEWLFRITQDPKRMAKRYLVDDRKILGLAIKYRKGNQ